MPPLDVRLVVLPSVPLAVVRRQVHRAQLGSAVREGCGLVWSFARERNLPAGRHVAVYRDGSIRLDVGVELAVPFEEQNGVVRSATPAGLTAFATVFGPYDRLGAAHAAIRDWCTTHAHRLAGPNWEIYDHWQTEWNADPSKIRTDIFYQVGVDAVAPSLANRSPRLRMHAWISRNRRVDAEHGPDPEKRSRVGRAFHRHHLEPRPGPPAR